MIGTSSAKQPSTQLRLEREELAKARGAGLGTEETLRKTLVRAHKPLKESRRESSTNPKP